MKIQKFTQLLQAKVLVTVCLSSSLAFAAGSVVYDFDSETDDDFFSSSVTGWSQDTTNPSFLGNEIPMSYIDQLNFGSGLSNGGLLGTIRGNLSPSQTTTISGAIDLDISGVAPNPGRSLSLNLAIFDLSGPTDPFPGRDAFRFSLTDDLGGNLATVDFAPTVGDDTSWDVSFGVNGTVPTTTNGAIFAGSAYIFDVIFDGADSRLLVGPASGGASPVLFGSRAPISANGFGDLLITHDPLNTVETSQNAIGFDNIVASIPEPSSALLLIFGVGTFFQRRRIH